MDSCGFESVVRSDEERNDGERDRCKYYVLAYLAAQGCLAVAHVSCSACSQVFEAMRWASTYGRLALHHNAPDELGHAYVPNSARSTNAMDAQMVLLCSWHPIFIDETSCAISCRLVCYSKRLSIKSCETAIALQAC